jgi:hypothetical protein
MIGVDWIAGLPTTAGGFDMIQNHVDLLSGKTNARDRDRDGRGRHHPQHVPSLQRRFPGRVGGGQRS